MLERFGVHISVRCAVDYCVECVVGFEEGGEYCLDSFFG